MLYLVIEPFIIFGSMHSIAPVPFQQQLLDFDKDDFERINRDAIIVIFSIGIDPGYIIKIPYCPQSLLGKLELCSSVFFVTSRDSHMLAFIEPYLKAGYSMTDADD